MKRGGDSLQLPPRVTRCIDTKAWWGDGGGVSSQPGLPDAQSVLLFPSFCLFGKEKHWRSVSCPVADWTKGPPDRERRSGWLMGFLFPHPVASFCWAVWQKKQKNKKTKPPPSALLATWELLSGKPQVVEYLAPQVRRWAAVCRFRQLPTVSDERREVFQEAVDTVHLSWATCTC